MSLTQIEFEAILSDQSKRIEGEITWSDDEDHSPAVEFRAEVLSDSGYPLFIRASYNGLAQTLTFALIHRTAGRIYALDLGKDHHNPNCQNVGRMHKHRCNELQRDKEAYVPTDITAPTGDPISVWRQFCVEVMIRHSALMYAPPPPQLEIF